MGPSPSRARLFQARPGPSPMYKARPGPSQTKPRPDTSLNWTIKNLVLVVCLFVPPTAPTPATSEQGGGRRDAALGNYSFFVLLSCSARHSCEKSSVSKKIWYTLALRDSTWKRTSSPREMRRNPEVEGTAACPSQELQIFCLKDLSVSKMSCELRSLREENKSLVQGAATCKVCMKIYSRPVNCWHAHCERCWLRALGEKKLCSQCKIITRPADLRRIYLWDT